MLTLDEDAFVISRADWGALGLHPDYWGCGRPTFLANNVINLQYVNCLYIVIGGVHHIGFFDTREKALRAISYLVLHGGKFGFDMSTKKG